MSFDHVTKGITLSSAVSEGNVQVVSEPYRRRRRGREKTLTFSNTHIPLS